MGSPGIKKMTLYYSPQARAMELENTVGEALYRYNAAPASWKLSEFFDDFAFPASVFNPKIFNGREADSFQMAGSKKSFLETELGYSDEKVSADDADAADNGGNGGDGSAAGDGNGSANGDDGNGNGSGDGSGQEEDPETKAARLAEEAKNEKERKKQQLKDNELYQAILYKLQLLVVSEQPVVIHDQGEPMHHIRAQILERYAQHVPLHRIGLICVSNPKA
jgi:hypothetical protein